MAPNTRPREKRKSSALESTKSRSRSAASTLLLMLKSPCTRPVGTPASSRSFKYTRPTVRPSRLTHTTLGRHLPAATVAQNSPGVSELEETFSEGRVIQGRACNADSTKHASGGAELDPAGTALASGQPGKPEVAG